VELAGEVVEVSGVGRGGEDFLDHGQEIVKGADWGKGAEVRRSQGAPRGGEEQRGTDDSKGGSFRLGELRRVGSLPGYRSRGRKSQRMRRTFPNPADATTAWDHHGGAPGV